MSTKVTVKGQVTLPKRVRDAAGIKAGDRVTVRTRPEGGVIVEKEPAAGKAEDFQTRLADIARRNPLKDGPFGGMSTDAIMQILRGED